MSVPPTPLQRYQIHARQRAERRALALAKPMTAVPFAGDPTIGRGIDRLLLDPSTREICLYATALMRRRGLLPLDASGFDAQLVSADTVVFIRADGDQAEVCRVIVQVVLPASEEDDGLDG